MGTIMNVTFGIFERMEVDADVEVEVGAVGIGPGDP